MRAFLTAYALHDLIHPGHMPLMPHGSTNLCFNCNPMLKSSSIKGLFIIHFNYILQNYTIELIVLIEFDVYYDFKIFKIFSIKNVQTKKFCFIYIKQFPCKLFIKQGILLTSLISKL